MVSSPHGEAFRLVHGRDTVALGMTMEVKMTSDSSSPDQTRHVQITAAAATDGTFRKGNFEGILSEDPEGLVNRENVTGFLDTLRGDGYLNYLK